jgi:hypothetical protein
MLDDESFTKEEANLCFYLSKFTVIDYAKDVGRYECLDLLSFFEAVTMVVRFKEIPKTAELKASGFSNGTLPELMAYLKKSGMTWDQWMLQHQSSNESKPDDPFHVRLDQILRLMMYMHEKKRRRDKARNR